MKYNTIIEALNQDTLYSPASIANFALEEGFVTGKTKKAKSDARNRIRIAMGRFSNNHQFPDSGDGVVILEGQAPTPGWYGWRWQAAYD